MSRNKIVAFAVIDGKVDQVAVLDDDGGHFTSTVPATINDELQLLTRQLPRNASARIIPLPGEKVEWVPDDQVELVH